MGRKSTASSSKRPSFFKVLIAADFHQKLRVSPAFIKHFDGKIPHKSILRGPTGKSWTIQVKRIGNDLYFCDGWEAFVNGHSLEFGDFLVFKYYGNLKFKVKIYGRTGCEKEVHLNFQEPSMLNMKKQKQGNAANEEEKYDLNRTYPLHFVSKRRHVTKADENRALELAKRAAATCKSAHFLKVMQASYVSHSFYIRIPIYLVEHLPQENEDVILSLEGKKWPANYYFKKSRSHPTISGSGWANFVFENNLEVGDVCLFEPAARKQRTFVFNVRVFRVVEEVVPLKMVRFGRRTMREN